VNRIEVTETIREVTEYLAARGKTSGREIRFLCPFHEDTNPSADWNPDNGTFICRSCGASGGALKLGAALPGFTLPQHHGNNGSARIDENFVRACEDRLRGNPAAIDFLVKQRHISADTIRRFRLGQTDSRDLEFLYPVFTTKGLFPSARIYRPGAAKGKRRWWRPAFAKIQSGLRAPVFGVVQAEELRGVNFDGLVVCEGEDKALALQSLDYPAVALTLGASNWPQHWMKHFTGKNVVFIPDVDVAGLSAIPRCEAFMRQAGASSLRVVQLPLAGTPDSKDVTDWLAAGGTSEALAVMIDDQPPILMGGAPPAPEPPQPPAQGHGHIRNGLTDWGNAQRLVRLHGDSFRYCYEWDKWLAWDGKCWSPDAEDVLGRYAKNVALDLHAESDRKEEEATRARNTEEREALQAEVVELRKWAQTTEKAERLRAILALAQSEGGVRVRPADLDRDHLLVNFQNGTFDLATGKFREHRQIDFITKISPVNYRAEAKSDLWENFVVEIMGGNVGLADYLRRAGGYAITGDVREQVLFFMHGTGANGKSTFIETILKTLGKDYAKEAAPQILMAKDHASHPTEIADLFGVRFVATVEIGEGRRLAEVLVKQLTGGDTLKARRMFEDFWSFEPTHKIFLAANHKPEITGTDYAIWRRIKMIPFMEKFEGAREDKSLKSRMLDELEGVAAWLVRGALEWKQAGLQHPPEVNAATEEYRSEMDVLGEFLRTRCVLQPFAMSKASALYDAYQDWARTAIGGSPMTQTMFGRRLAERGFLRDKQRKGYIWKGVGVLTQEAADDNYAPDTAEEGERSF
jgi:P4 family phage/plasmid primase-like protien